MSSNDIMPMLKEILSRISVLESKIEGSGSGGAAAPATNMSGAGDLPASVKGFDSYSSALLDPFESACNKLGGDAQAAGAIVKSAWQEMRKIIVMAAACKEPSQAALPGLLTGVSSKIKEASAVVKRNEWEKHTKTVSEGLSCLNWCELL